MAQKLIRHELVEIPVKAGSTVTKYQIPDLPNLRNVHLFGVEIYNGNDRTPGAVVNNASVPKGIQTGLDVISFPNLQKGFLTLVNYGGKEFSKQTPLIIFNSIFNGSPAGPILPLEWNTKSYVGQKVNYPKSYIEFTSSPAEVIDTVIMLSIYYSLPEGEEKRESGFSFGKRG